KVINLIDPSDTATSSAPLSDPPVRVPPGAGNAPPVATDVAILGQTTVGVTLTGLYVYSDAEGDAEGQSTYRWITSLGGTETTVGTSQSYTLTVADVDRVISFEVTPVALTGTSPGQPVVSTSIGPISTNHKPEAQNVAISLVRISGKWTLVGTFTYYDAEGDPEGIHQYQWYKMDNNGNILPISGATSTQWEVHPTSSNRGKYYFSVTPVALTGTSPGDNVRTDHYEVN
ncbi:MAG: hypothetical protein R6W96_08350, partial [Clostridia bacterium]